MEWYPGDSRNGQYEDQSGDSADSSADESGYNPGIEMCNRCEKEEEAAMQSHVHEYLGSTQLANENGHGGIHNHRFAGVSNEAIYVPGSHVHRVIARTDYFDHYHELQVISGPAIYVYRNDSAPGRYDRKHVHFVQGMTSRVDGHSHDFEAGTLIEAQLVREDR